ncbi:Fructose dehydrogenase small subunit [Paraburkholderia ultramafica]|uniref:Fructose dehydrogenase small subunit n=2 Tax=Paraburkholderia ultramafica TaxID=1544867 RepID=A0A6S7BQL4_9BURK|nr:Fructose dehydrogenase small subunit [Paraburkholderia ultramafica]
MGGFAVLPTLAVSSSDVALPDESLAQFMEISSLLIQHQLDPGIGKRLAIAMTAANASLSGHITELLAIARKKNATVVEDFFPDVPVGPLKETALSIISAWYLGVLTDASGAEVFAYEFALMYQPTVDVMTIPTYAKSGPNGWNADAPPLSDMPKF